MASQVSAIRVPYLPFGRLPRVVSPIRGFLQWTLSLLSVTAMLHGSTVVVQPTSVLAHPPLFGTYAATNARSQTGITPGYTSGVTAYSTYIGQNPVQETLGALTSTFVTTADGNATGDWDFDLGATYVVKHFLFWNTQSDLTSHVKNFEIFVGDDAGFASAVSAGSFTAAPSSTEYPTPLETFDLTPTAGRYVRFRVTSNNGSTRTLWGEVAFGASVPVVPLIVTTTADSGLDATIGASYAFDVTDGTGLSLREAVHWANADDDADIIGFSSLVEGTITLGSTIAISKDLTIQGPGASVLGVSGGGATRVFTIDDGSISTNAEVTVRGLTITGSADELHPELNASLGAIEAVENVAIEHCVFTGNAGMALSGFGYDENFEVAGTYVLSVTNTIFTSNAQGALYLYGGGGLIVNHSTLTGNGGSESLSGAIQTSGTLSVEISSSYIAGNASSDYGPAIYLYKASRPGVSATLTNLTITDNTSGSNAWAAVFANGVPATLQNCTLYDNNIVPGGSRASELYVSLTNATVNNSIIWHSTYGPLSGNGTNATIVVQSGSTLAINNSVAGSHITSLAAPSRINSVSQDPLLSAAAAQGGPTFTLPLQIGSPAIDLGNAEGAPSTDGRGFTRNTSGGVDAGAYERAAMTFQFAGEPTPLPGALEVNPAANLLLDYGHVVAKSAGTVTIRNADTASVIESFDVSDSRVSIDSGRIVINPAATLPTSAAIQVDVAAGAFIASIDDASATSLTVAGGERFHFETSATAPASPEIEIVANGHPIADGASTPSATNHTDFGDAAVPGGSVSRTFTITNSGTGELTLPGEPKVTLSGTNAADFSVTTSPISPVSASGGTTTFTILFAPSALGVRTAGVSVATDDSDENPYTFAIQGTGTDGIAPTVVSVERLSPLTQVSNATTFVFRVTYSETVTNVSASEFAIEAVNGGTATGDITDVSGSGATRDVTVSITEGSGEFRLNVVQ